MRRSGMRFPLMRGDGTRLGTFAITRISESHSHLMRDGRPFVLGYSVTCKKVAAGGGYSSGMIAGLLSLFGVA